MTDAAPHENFELDPPPVVVRKRTVGVVTYTLIGLNVAVFLAMIAAGVPFFEPGAQQVLPWGADFGPLTTSGQWWRLLTSCFLHFGIIHIAMNMYILFQIGPFAEAIFGRWRFLFLYLLAGIGGNIAGLYIHPFVVAAGASGAIFGLYGTVLAFLFIRRGVIPSAAASSILRSAGIFIAYNFFYGLRSEGTDLTAHIGGLVSGFLLGCLMAWTLAATTLPERNTRTSIASLVSVALLVAGLIFVPRSDAAQADWYRVVMTGPSITAGNNDEVFYGGGATKDDATRVGQALVDLGFFSEKNIPVVLNKDASGWSLSIEFNGDESHPPTDEPLPWNNPQLIGEIHEVATRLATAVNTPSFTVRMLDSKGTIKKAIQ